jgi:hypothetical protein
MDTDSLTQIAPGIHGWRATHPDWHATTELVASYALEVEDGLLVVDPLLADGRDGDAILAELRHLAADRPVAVFITIPYHVRSSERVATELGAPIHAHPAVADRLDDPSLLRVATGTDASLPFGVQALRIGNPIRYELPLHAPGVRALVVGDCIVGVRGGLRIWEEKSDGEWYRSRFLPSIAHLAELDVDHVLTTHGEPVLDEGATALREMLEADAIATITRELAGDAVPR